jgi:hypothetical protein
MPHRSGTFISRAGDADDNGERALVSRNGFAKKEARNDPGLKA